MPPNYQDDRVKETKPNRKKVQRVGTAPVRDKEANEEIDILPTELEKIKKVTLNIQRRFLRKPMSFAEMDAVEDAIKNAFTVLGFRVDVGWDMQTDRKGTVAGLPTITLLGRTEEEFDHDAMSWEVQHGLLDGVVGKMTNDGKLVDPNIVL